ncbi:MAG TPA: MBL fold metallo-hydrolase [Kofleriaceae bacterium]|nr:MBL fold metallo-hydrolase [Kofleriaceae bacterium]
MIEKDLRPGATVDAVYEQVRNLVHTSPSGVIQPTPAVACVMWRRAPSSPHPLEVYVARRSVSHPFLGGFWGFPGGRIEAADKSPIAACAREVHEELGVDLPLDPAAWREIVRFATPELAPVRFEARYYLVEAPAGCAPDPGVSRELERGLWITPEAAVAAHERGEWLVPTPVVITVAELARGTEGPALEERLAAASRADFAARGWPLAGGAWLAPVRTLTLPPATHTNAYIFGTRELVVVDPGSPFEDEQAALEGELARMEASGARLRAILLTHHHQDHSAGAAALAARTGAPVWAHAVTAQLLEGVVAVERTIADGEVIELAGEPARRLRAIFTPGHAPGHLCFLEEETGFAAVGDMVAGLGTILIDPSEGDMRQYLDSLAVLAAAAPRALLPAHGPPIADPAGKIAEYVRHRLWREERVAAALPARGRATARDLVPEAYSDVVPALFGLAERSLIAHLVKLAGDGRVRLVGDVWEVV